jgi:hypothetical protein
MRGVVAAAGLMFILTLIGRPVHADSAQPGYNAASLYNSANAYALAGKPGMAVLNYERARLLAPNDPDIEVNLRRVRQSAHVALEPAAWFEPLVTVANPRVLSWLGLAGVILACGSVLAGRLQPRHRLLRHSGTLVGLLLMGLTLGNAVMLWPRVHAAVVIVADAPARVSPVPLGDPLFVLPEAEMVRIGASHEGFVLVQTAAGRSGWVSQTSVAAIVPGAGLFVFRKQD